MLKHIVLFRRKAEVPAQPALEQRLVAQMDALVHQIDFIREWKLSANELQRPICWGYALESAFDDVQALNDYLFHPAHQALVAELKPYFEWAAVDYTVC